MSSKIVSQILKILIQTGHNIFVLSVAFHKRYVQQEAPFLTKTTAMKSEIRFRKETIEN